LYYLFESISKVEIFIENVSKIEIETKARMSIEETVKGMLRSKNYPYSTIIEGNHIN